MKTRIRTSRRNERHGLMLAALAVLLIAVTVRVLYLQVYAAPAFAERAEAQRTRELEIAPRRGAILDRSGNPLALSIEARTVYATPRLVTDTTATAQALAGVLGGDIDGYAEKLRRDSGFVYIARKLEMEKAAAVEALDLDGIGLIKDSRRLYPCGDLASQLLGFVGIDDQGLAGLELHYDSVLSGEAGYVLAERDPSGRILPGGVIHEEKPVDGHDIVISIDKDIQFAAQYHLQAAVDKWQAKSASIVVMDPRSGEVLAIASAPGFDPNDFAQSEESARRNRAITDVYEPGSTLKSITSAAVVDAGIHEPDDTLELPPTIKVGGRTIKESEPRQTVTWSLTEILAQSSNVGTVLLGQALGPERLWEYLDRFGLTERTGIDFPGEALGHVPPVNEWSGSSIGNIPFGQGVSMTTLQLARALSAIANGGEMVSPHFLLDVPGRSDMEFEWPVRQVISAKAAAATTRMLEAAVSDGTGASAAVPGHQVAGKTGTAQKPRTDGRGYAEGAYIASFSGFLPAHDPQLLIVVMVDEPRGAIYGGAVAAPVFREVASFAVAHLKIPPAVPASQVATDTVLPDTDEE
ncbi:MAG: penicillin-binding protein 2 [Clostridiales bacterium]|nr:penicillin-binding protein 2 [Clostridiales bacterium]